MKDRAGEVWSLTWPGGGAILLLLGDHCYQGNTLMLRALTLTSDDATLDLHVEDWWIHTWFTEPQNTPGLTSKRLA